MTRPHHLFAALLLGSPLLAAPVPKPAGPDVDALLARVRVENLGGMLAQPSVAKALSLTDQQSKKIEDLTDAIATRVKGKFAAMKRQNGGAAADAMFEVFGMIGEMNGELDAEVAKVLTADQLRRVRQLQLQKEGPAALLGRHGIRAINPTAEQEDKMATELAKWRKLPMADELIASSTGALGGPGNNELPAINKLLDQFSTETEAVQEAMLKVLTAEQRVTWAKMVGDPLPRKELLQASSAFGDGKLVRAIDEAQNAQLPPPPAPAPAPVAPAPVVIPAGGAAPPPLPPAEKK